MSKDKNTNLICILISVFMVIFTIGFMNGEKFGVIATESDKTADLSGSFSSRDLDGSWNEAASVHIDLDHLEGLTYSGAYELDGNLYLIAKGTYVLSGTLENHNVIVNAKDCKLQIVLSGVNITCEDTAGIYVKSADKVFLSLAEGTENSVTFSGTLSEEAEEAGISAAIYSRDDLSINGEGSLTVECAEYNGIRSSDDLVIAGGDITVNAGENGIVGHDSLRIAKGTLNIKAGKDGLKANNETEKGYVLIAGGDITVDAENDAIQAETDLTITGGTFDLTSGGGYTVPESPAGIDDAGGMQPQMPEDMQNSEAPEDMPEMPAGDMQNGFGQPGTPPDGMQMPEGEMPEGMNGFGAPPEGNQMPGGQMPGGMGGPVENGQMPQGEMPEGMNGMGTPPDGMQMPDGEIPEGMNGFDPQAEMPQEQMPEEDMNNGRDSETASDETSGSYKGLKAGNSILISGGEFKLSCKDDAVHSDGTIAIEGGTFNIVSGDDGLHAEDVLTINDGTIIVEYAYEGIEGADIIVNGGDITLTTRDDGFNAGSGNTMMPNGMGRPGSSDADTDSADLALLEFNGGTIIVNAQGDGLDSNGNLVINGGTIYVNGPSDGANGALDSGTESGGDLYITGGTLIALGSSQMAESFSENSRQVSIAGSFNGTYRSEDQLYIKDAEGNTVFEYTVSKSGNSIVFSSPQLREGETYTVTVGDLETQLTASIGASATGAMNPGAGGMGEMRPDDNRRQEQMGEGQDFFIDQLESLEGVSVDEQGNLSITEEGAENILSMLQNRNADVTAEDLLACENVQELAQLLMGDMEQMGGRRPGRGGN